MRAIAGRTGQEMSVNAPPNSSATDAENFQSLTSMLLVSVEKLAKKYTRKSAIGRHPNAQNTRSSTFSCTSSR